MSSREHPKHDQAEALAPPHPVGRRLRSAFIKFATHFPYNAKVCLNGHHYAQQQAHAAGITFPSRRSTTASCPPTTQPGSSGSATPSGHERIDTFRPADRTAGYRYDVSILQAEFARTQVLDRSLAGRVFFEEVIRDNLDAGRPDRVSLIFARHLIKTTRGGFGPGWSTTACSRRCTSTTSTPRSSSTTSSTAPFGPRPRSTTRATSGSANASTTFPHSGRSASWPTVACWRPNASAVTPPRGDDVYDQACRPKPSATNGSPGCAWMRSGRRCCCRHWSCSACCPTGSPP